jgi:hypothetical protein
VTRARITQIMKLLDLAPDIQEQILFLPLIQGLNERRDPLLTPPIKRTTTENCLRQPSCMRSAAASSVERLNGARVRLRQVPKRTQPLCRILRARSLSEIDFVRRSTHNLEVAFGCIRSVR